MTENLSRRRNNTAKYTKLPTQERDDPDGFVDEQFQVPKPTFKWKTIIFIMVFLIAGALCLTFGILISTGHIDKKFEDRAWPLLILGILMFIPGGYFGYILICIYLKRDGFTIDDIPVF